MIMKNSLLVFGTNNLNKSLKEIEEYLDFSLIFANDAVTFNNNLSNTSVLLIDSESCKDIKILNLINSSHNKPVLLIEKLEFQKKCNYTEKISFPTTLLDFNHKIIALIISKKFNQNSSIQIKEYLIDKNEKKIKKNNLSATITEREIELIELLFHEVRPLSKNNLLKKIWKYSEDADTHTVETHIYRLRKKIVDKFSDDKFIINTKAGYSI